MPINIERRIEEIVGLNILAISNSRIVPGSILESDENSEAVGHIETYLLPYLEASLGDRPLALEKLPADFAMHAAGGHYSDDAAIQILGVLGLGVRRRSQFQLTWKIEQAEVCQFAAIDKFALETAFQALKQQNEAQFSMLSHHFLVFKTYYARSFYLEFLSASGGTAALDIDRDLDISASLTTQRRDNVIFATNNSNSPFGVFGYEITRRGTVLEEP